MSHADLKLSGESRDSLRDSFHDSLRGIGVLIARHALRAANLSARIEQCGGRAFVLPVLDIAAPKNPDVLHRAIENLTAADLAIFISVNAVESVVAMMRENHLSLDAKVAAVGPQTARACEAANIEVAFMPDAQIDSEGLLAALRAVDVADKKAVIFRAQNGRNALGDGLRARGAVVEYIESYRREIAAVSDAQVAELCARKQAGEIDAIVATSGAGVDALGKLTRDTLLMQTPIFTYNRRLAAYCRQCGFTDARAASGVGDDALLAAIVDWAIAPHARGVSG